MAKLYLSHSISFLIKRTRVSSLSHSRYALPPSFVLFTPPRHQRNHTTTFLLLPHLSSLLASLLTTTTITTTIVSRLSTHRAHQLSSRCEYQSPLRTPTLILSCTPTLLFSSESRIRCAQQLSSRRASRYRGSFEL